MKNKVLLAVESILYCAGLVFLIFSSKIPSFFNYLCLFIAMLILNILLILFIDRDKKYYSLKIIVFNLFVTLFIFITPGVIKSLFYNNTFLILDFLKYILFAVIQTFITANWLIPFIVKNIFAIKNRGKIKLSDNNKVVELDGRLNRNKKTLLRNLAKELDFPAQGGESWNSLSTCLQDLGWIKNRRVLIFINNPDFLLLEEKPVELRMFKDCLKTASDYWRRQKSNSSKVDSVIEFNVVFMNKVM